MGVGRGVNKSNESYLIRLVTSRSEELYFRADGEWWKTSARGRTFRATSDQVLNHLLPAFAGLARGLSVHVEHFEDPSDRPVPMVPRGPTSRSAVK